MKRNLFLLIFICTTLFFFLSSCDTTSYSACVDGNEHQFGDISYRWRTYEDKCDEWDYIQVCQVCSHVKVVKSGTTCKPGGSWKVEKEATCKKEGERIKNCLICGNVAVTQTIPVTDHQYGADKWDWEEVTDGQCPSWERYKTCKYCNKKEIVGRGVDHDFDVETKPSTCTVYGYDKLTCRRCGEVEIEKHTKLASHTFSKEYDSDADFHWYLCVDCGAEGTKTEHTEAENGICTICQNEVGYTEGVLYQLSDDKTYAIVTGYQGPNKRIRIMPEYQGVPVTHIGEKAFMYHFQLISISLTENITHIGYAAFYSCSDLRNIWHLTNVTYIGDDAFNGNCNMKLSRLPSNLEYIGDRGFLRCNSITISVIPDSVYYLGEEAFSSCGSIKSIKIGNGITEINAKAFERSGLKSITFGENLLSIGDNAFYDCSLESLFLPESLVSIGESCFQENPMKSVYLGKNFENMGYWAFSHCSSFYGFNVHEDNAHFTSVNGTLYTKDLTTIVCYPSGKTTADLVIPEGVTNIADYAFYNARIQSLTLPTTLTEIGLGAFRACEGLKSIQILGPTKIGDYAFGDCRKLVSMQLSEQVTTIGAFAFYNCGFTEIVIPDHITSMGDWAFCSCYYLERVTVGKGLKTIPERAFSYAPYLHTVVISDGVETISSLAFADCYQLENIVLGQGIKEIAPGAFEKSEDIKNIYYKGTGTSWQNIVIATDNIGFINAKKYFYRETQPDQIGNYWYYDEEGNVQVW